ncbi:MAG: hypothetical protein Q9195_008166 [Heterodermia aff. obscurata]
MAPYDLPDNFQVLPELRNLKLNIISNLRGDHVILLQPVPGVTQLTRHNSYRGSCASYLCRKEFRKDEMSVSVEEAVKLGKPFSDHEPPQRDTEMQRIGLNTKATRIFHLRCLDEVLTYDNGPGLRAFAERLYPEFRANQYGPAGMWLPNEAQGYITEVWKAVHTHANRRRSNPMIPRGTLPKIILTNDHNYQLHAGPDNTLFEIKEAFDLYTKVASLAIPNPLRTARILDRPLHHFLNDKPSMRALQLTIDAANQAGPAAAPAPLVPLEERKSELRRKIVYYIYMAKQGLASQAPASYFFKDKAAKAEKDLNLALKIGHNEPSFKLADWLPRDMDEAERNAALKRERYYIMSGMDLGDIGEEGPVMGVLAEGDEGEEMGEEAYEDDEVEGSPGAEKRREEEQREEKGKEEGKKPEDVASS